MSDSGSYVTVVSGMPRSGTSMMMQMLEAGGMPIVADANRPADVHNLRGYFEDERARRLAQESGWLVEARGKAVKIIYRLLRHLPADLEYRVIFMERDADEVFASQRDMLIDRRDRAAEQDREKMIRAMSADLEATKGWLNAQPNMRCLWVPYAEVVSEPAGWARRIADFLGGEMDQEAMAGVVTPSLYRHRSSLGES